MVNSPIETIPPQHPGITIIEDVLEPLGMSMNALALELRVPATRISEIAAERGRFPPKQRYGWRGGWVQSGVLVGVAGAV